MHWIAPRNPTRIVSTGSSLQVSPTPFCTGCDPCSTVWELYLLQVPTCSLGRPGANVIRHHGPAAHIVAFHVGHQEVMPFPELWVLPTGCVRVCENQGVKFLGIAAVPLDAGGAMLDLQGCPAALTPSPLSAPAACPAEGQHDLRGQRHPRGSRPFVPARPGPSLLRHGHHRSKAAPKAQLCRSDSARGPTASRHFAAPTPPRRAGCCSPEWA